MSAPPVLRAFNADAFDRLTPSRKRFARRTDAAPFIEQRTDDDPCRDDSSLPPQSSRENVPALDDHEHVKAGALHQHGHWATIAN
jgi:hypothetical protein